MSALVDEARKLKAWLFDAALPLWWKVGADHLRGGFYEAIDLAGNPVARPHRARSIARQAFAFCEAGQLGWEGPWREAAEHALHYFEHFIRPDGSVIAAVKVDGSEHETRFDLYNQAFALLAYGVGERLHGPGSRWRQRALALRDTLQKTYAHPLGGHVEDSETRLPPCANPHMHLFEAALLWSEIDDDVGWQRMADEIAFLCLEKFIDPASGALREFFAADWSPAPGIQGNLCEPGHLYEWAFLLHCWAARANRSRPRAVGRLISFADRCGLDTARGVAVNAVLTDGRVHDPVARLWAQAERIRAYVVEARSEADTAAATAGLWRFLGTEKRGLWFDQLDAEDRFVMEPARATSLYHIVGAVTALSSAGALIADGGTSHRPAGTRACDRAL
jgi:mannose/cellobiose epimerase-like protein (N-acyl-D-glucosamine 2-epimerase family)